MNYLGYGLMKPQSQAGSLLPVTGWSPSGLLLGVSSTSQSLPVFAQSGEKASLGCTGVLINITFPGRHGFKELLFSARATRPDTTPWKCQMWLQTRVRSNSSVGLWRGSVNDHNISETSGELDIGG
ncbi:hypothetical protein RRG08_031575 [Elysia crispata]|uniref:Uncharacterized protein n=1 Tax=Elysia crispata TaxID=231223 RepID=A0AAE1B2T2_9GAST|nr:hypothetical protein RRG08_031575 [Elysia crispata]